MRSLPPLAALRAFEAAARHLSFRRAADELGVTPTAISHQVRLLEEVLGKRLFERRTRRVLLTPTGQMLFPVLREAFDAVAQTVTVAKASGEPVVTLTATMAFTSRWLVPRVASFRARHPQLRLRLLASDEVVDLRAGAADIAVRYGPGSYPGCRAEFLMPGRFAPVCSPALGVKEPADLDRHPLLHFEWRRVARDTPLWPLWFARAGRPYRADGGELLFSDETHAIEAALAGQGAVLASLVLVADELARGALVCPFGPVLEHQAFHVVVPERRAEAPAIAAVMAWLRDEAATCLGRLP